MPAMDSQPRVGDLRNEIYAVFRRQNFKNISDLEYDALRPSLQFASHFLTTPELAGFPHAILLAPYKHSRIRTTRTLTNGRSRKKIPS
jgi:hypothetical protein